MAIWWRLFATGAVTYGIYRDNDRQPNRQTERQTDRLTDKHTISISTHGIFYCVTLRMVSHYAWIGAYVRSVNVSLLFSVQTSITTDWRVFRRPHTEQHLNRFIRFCRAHARDRQTDRDHATCVTMCTAMRRSVCVCGGTYEVEEQRMLLTRERRREPRSHTTLSKQTTTFSPTNLHNKHTILSLHIQDTQTYPCVNITHYSYASCEVLFFVKVDGIYIISIVFWLFFVKTVLKGQN